MSYLDTKTEQCYSSRVGIPEAISRRIVERGLRDRAVVVVFRKGRPVRVFGLEEYLRMKRLPGAVKPWLKRRRGPPADPLAAFRVPGGRVLKRLRRSEFYES